jgi:hypothetical protein
MVVVINLSAIPCTHTTKGTCVCVGQNWNEMIVDLLLVVLLVLQQELLLLTCQTWKVGHCIRLGWTKEGARV